MGERVPAECADLVVKQKARFIQSMIEGALPGKLPNLIKKTVCLGECALIHHAIISNNHAVLYKKIAGKVGG